MEVRMSNKELLMVIIKKLHISYEEVNKIFKLGNVTDEDAISNVLTECENETLEGFLNGFIVYKRGPKEDKPGIDKKVPLSIKGRESTNNVVFKKLKIAFSLTNDDIVEIFESSKVRISKNDLTMFLRKEGHKHYRNLDDNYLKIFMDGVNGY
jgi:uncharacterized protein YehS (DUF1456 family)